MAKPKLTQWFPADTKPARKGVYEREYTLAHAYSRWTGNKWMAGSYEVDVAARRVEPSWNQSAPWRGLASDPSATVGKGRP